jgi:hypothetical protein
VQGPEFEPQYHQKKVGEQRRMNEKAARVKIIQQNDDDCFYSRY